MEDFYEESIRTVKEQEARKDRRGGGKCEGCGMKVRKEYRFCENCMTALENGQDIIG